MPIYEYQCQECDERLEKLQRMSDDPLTDCPACGKPALKRLVSAAAFRLKGAGWYETDFKQGNKRNLAGSDSESKPSDKGKQDAKGSDAGADKSKSTSGKASEGKSDSAAKSSSAKKKPGKSAGKTPASA